MTFDYKTLHFKAGLEIHQQLEGKKLFCHCPTLVNDSHPVDIVVQRKLRTSAGETGSVDVAAKYETAKNRMFVYEACSTSSCLVELDDEPPHDVNREALLVALQIAKIMHAKTVDEVQFMRKIVVDGSNVSSFQRTAVIALDGYIDTSKGKVSIASICLEEESAKKIETKDTEVIYRLDRLGVPLIEIATGPDLQDPFHAQEVAGILGMILRSTGKVRRGLGSIRQDVNISIQKGNRVELKGFQDLRSISKVIDVEIDRQLALLKKGKKVEKEVRKVEPDFTTSFLRPMPGASRMYPETDVTPISITSGMLNSLEVPQLITERALGFEQKYGLSEVHAREILKLNLSFDYYAENYKLSPEILASVLIDIPKELKARFKADVSKLTQQDFDFVFTHLQQETFGKEAVFDVLLTLSQGKKVDLHNYKSVSLDDVERFVKDLIKKNPTVSLGGLMGDVMKHYKGKVDGKKVMELLKKFKP